MFRDSSVGLEPCLKWPGVVCLIPDLPAHETKAAADSVSGERPYPM